MLPRTDLAVEIGEKYREDNVEIEGVVIEEYAKEDLVKVTTVDIVNENGSKAMSRPIGRYITIEILDGKDMCVGSMVLESMRDVLTKNIEEMIKKVENKRILIVGLGNKDVTPDSLGPLVIEEVNVTRHIIREYGEDIINISAIAPGVMGQTGMEVGEIVEAIVKELDINIVIAIDALAARSINRLNRTIQLTNTGICPGAGVGNNRKELSKKTLGAEVVAIGVPTVVDATTIVNDTLEQYLSKQGFDIEEIQAFNDNVRKEVIDNMFVTSKDIDECIRIISRIIGQSLNRLL